MSNHPDPPGIPLAPPARDLPPGRHQALKAQFMDQIQDAQPARSRARVRRPVWVRPVFALPAVAAAVAAAVVVSVAAGGGGSRPGTVDPRAAVLLERVARTASTRPELTVRPDQFLFTEQRITDQERPAGGDKPPATPLMVRRDWASPDGAKHWVAQLRTGGKPDEFPVTGGDRYTSYDAVKALPVDPDALLARIKDQASGKGSGPDQEAFVVIGDLVMTGYPLPKLNAALFRAAARIPGVTVLNSAVDPDGRPGIGIARTDETDGAQVEWLFTQDYRYLGERQVGRDGKARYLTVHLRTAVVDQLKQLP